MDYNYYTVEDLEKDIKEEVLMKTKEGRTASVRFATGPGMAFHILSAYYDKESNTFWFDIEEDGTEEDPESPDKLHSASVVKVDHNVQ